MGRTHSGSEQTGVAMGRFCFVLQGAKEKNDLAPGSVKEQNMKIRETDKGTGYSSENVLGKRENGGVFSQFCFTKQDCY